MKLVGAALVLLSISGCSAEVVENVTICGDFFADPDGIVSPPSIFNESRYKQICQTLNNKAEYATYYDTMNRIPVYSAYRFRGSGHCDRKASWFIEPQLYNQNEDKNMVKQRRGYINTYGRVQALDRDYNRSGYDKGHLAPVRLINTQSCSDATFTLTNAAPQNPSFNRGHWMVAEGKMAKYLSAQCLDKGLSAYIVTGVVPGNEEINARVNVPSYFWSSYCCLDNNKKPKVSGGFYGENVDKPVKFVTVSELEVFLKGAYNKDSFVLFGNGCNVMDQDFGSVSRKRSRTDLDLERFCAKHHAYRSSTNYGSTFLRLRSQIDAMCAAQLTRSRTEHMCNLYGFSRSGPESPVQNIYLRHIGFARFRQISRVCARHFGYAKSLIEEYDDE